MKNTVKILAVALSFVAIASCVAIASLGSCGKKGGGGNNTGDTGNSSVSSSSEQPEDIQLSLNKTALTLTEDEMEFLSVTSNTLKTATWSSDNESVATVSVVGKVIAKSAGTATITVQIGKKTAQCVVTVLAAAEKTKDYIDVEGTAYLSLEDENAPQIIPRYIAVGENGEEVDGEKSFTFTSLNTDVVTVDDRGVLTSVGVGKADVEVSCGELVTYVVVDVYTDLITTTDEWLSMLGNKDLFARYYLASDLDFTGVTYNIEPLAGREKGFYGELNGGRHTVSNITVTGNTGTEGQSLFGGAKCIDIYDIAFTNVTYTDSKASGLCSSLMQHVNLSDYPDWVVSGSNLLIDGKVIEGAIPMKEMDKVIFPSKVNNVILDASFVGHGNVGFCKSFYGGIISNLYINMRRGDDQSFTETDFMFAQTLHIWYSPNAASNTIVRIDRGILTEEISAVDSYGLAMSDVTYTTDEMQANYKAYQIFDKAVWAITPKGIPAFVKQ